MKSGDGIVTEVEYELYPGVIRSILHKRQFCMHPEAILHPDSGTRAKMLSNLPALFEGDSIRAIWTGKGSDMQTVDLSEKLTNALQHVSSLQNNQKSWVRIHKQFTPINLQANKNFESRRLLGYQLCYQSTAEPDDVGLGNDFHSKIERMRDNPPGETINVRSHLDQLERAIPTGDAGLALIALRSLRLAGPAGAPAVPVLVRLVRTHPGLREEATQVLARMGPSIVRDVLPLLKDQNPEVRHRAALILASIRPQNSKEIEALVEALDDPNPTVRRFSASALGQIGPAASLSLGKLAELLRNDLPAVRHSAASALASLVSLQYPLYRAP